MIVARDDDRHATTVAEILKRDHRVDTVILDFSFFPQMSRLSALFTSDGPGVQFTDRHGRRIDFSSIRSFWWRRPQALQLDSRVADPQAQHFALQESLSALYGILRCCPGLWVNDIEHDHNADFKPRQLAAMQRLGLPVPETLITNDPDEARAFFDRHNGEVVYKAFNQRGILWLPTKRLMAADLAYLDQLSCAPVIFQRYVEGVRDIRVTVVGNFIFASEFAIEGSTCVDHRLIMGTTACAAHRLPPATERDVVALVRALNLEYASVDLRLTGAGEYVFFEVNTAGEFLYLQDRTGQPIAAAVASHLAAGVPACANIRPALAVDAPVALSVSKQEVEQCYG
jgi:hypothetical protein